MLKITTWKPDTCTCELEYEWDDAVMQDARVHTLKRIISVCSAHSGLLVRDIYPAVMDENTRKNKLLGVAIENIAQIREPDPDTGAFRLKAGIEYRWSFDANRILTVFLTGLAPAQKSNLQNLANSEFGPNKIVIQ